MVDKRWLVLVLGLALAWVHDPGALAASRVGPGPRQDGIFEALTYNVAGLPEGISAAHPAASSVVISPRLNTYDLVLLQEDFSYHDLVTAAADHSFRSLPQLVLATLVNDGLTHLSRFPLRAFERVRWPVASGILGNYHDAWAAKGFSVATAELAPGARLDVYNLHGDAGSDVADQAARATAYERFAAFLAQHSAGRAVIVGGDFNLDLADPVDAEVFADLLARTGLQDAGMTLGDARPCFDRFLFRASDDVALMPLAFAEATEFTLPDGEPLSDHPAMRSRWAWRWCGHPARSTSPAALARDVAHRAGVGPTGPSAPFLSRTLP